MALSRKNSRMLKQLMTTLKDEIYDVDSPHMQKEKEERIRNPEHVIQRKSRSERCPDDYRFRASYTPPKRRSQDVVEPEPTTKPKSERLSDFGDEYHVNILEPEVDLSSEWKGESDSDEEYDVKVREPGLPVVLGSESDKENDSGQEHHVRVSEPDLPVTLGSESERESDSDHEVIVVESSEEDPNGDEVEQEDSSIESDVEGATKNTETESKSSSGTSFLNEVYNTIAEKSAGLSFESLPLELRTEVYRQLLCIPGGLEIQVTHIVPASAGPVHRGFKWVHRNPQNYGPKTLHVDILRTNVLIHTEAMTILYGQNAFRIDNVSHVMPFFNSLSFLARLLVGQVDVVHLHGPEYLHAELLGWDYLTNELVFMHKRWESTLFYMAVELKLKKVDIYIRAYGDEYLHQREKLRGAVVRCCDARYPWIAEFGASRMIAEPSNQYCWLVAGVKLTVVTEDE
ncbi:MAG: hypothetical protein M1816_001538 [Peltula sp. TS41687]|nr:MAG: hypothetical protein M1816_001538 [Peltula sp. TS41687]